MATPISLEKWLIENENAFEPPVCNKMMYSAGQLKVMYVAGVNERKDYHIEEGEEIFYMHKGSMVLPIFEKGKPIDIVIKEGEWFLLPSRIPHSPQRPEKESRGLVIERERRPNETDALRYYTADRSEILWEEWFHCHDLGVQLKPVIAAFKASEQFRTGKPIPGDHINPSPPFALNRDIAIQRPVKFSEWLLNHGSKLSEKGISFLGFNGSESKVLVFGEGSTALEAVPVETLLWQHKGTAMATVGGQNINLNEGDYYLVQAAVPFTVARGNDSIGIQIQMFPLPSPDKGKASQ